MRKSIMAVVLSLTITLSVPGYAMAVTDTGSALMQDAKVSIENVDKAELSVKLTKFQKAKTTALSKMYVNYPTIEIGRNEINATVDVSKLKPAVCIEYGNKKTTEADKVFLKESYYDPTDESDSQYGKWEEITLKSCEKISKAQSYVEINDALDEVKRELSKLIPAGEEEEIHKLQKRYINALEKYKNQAVIYKDSSKYAKNPDNTTIKPFEEAFEKGKTAIRNAGSKETITETYVKAQDLIDDVKTDDYLLNQIRGVNNAVMSLPKVADISFDDINTVMMAYERIKEYSDSPGTTLNSIVAARTILQRNIQKIINDEAKKTTSDAKFLGGLLDSIAADERGNGIKTVFFKDARQITESAKCLTDIIDRVNADSILDGDKDAKDLFDSQIGPSVYRIAKATEINGDIFWAQIDNTITQMNKAAKKDAKSDQVEYARNCYNDLTDLQKYIVESEGLKPEIIKLVFK